MDFPRELQTHCEGFVSLLFLIHNAVWHRGSLRTVFRPCVAHAIEDKGRLSHSPHCCHPYYINSY